MKQFIFALLTGLFILWGCSSDSLQGPEARVSKISLTVQGLNDPGPDMVYNAWLSWNDMSQQLSSTELLGTIESTGNNEYTKSKNLNLGFLQGAEYVLITMDTAGSTTPSSFNIIAANLFANSGTFRLGHKQVLDYNFENATATFFLDTPTEEPPSANPTSGIWFASYEMQINDILDSTGAVVGKDTVETIDPGLDLAILPVGWEYEALVLSGSDTFSIGRFRAPEGPDRDNTYSGPNPAYLVPGEDFLTNDPAMPLDLRGRTVIVKMTPNYPEEGNMPFEVVVFQGTIPTDAQAKTNYTLDNMTDTWPTGQLTTEVSLYQ
jgi:hypothetical protein